MLKVSISGNAEFKVGELKGKTKTLPKAIAKATVFLERQQKVRFASQTDPDGKAWAGLSPSTLARKKTNAILRETSTLANSINSSSAGLIGQVSASTEYGIYHQSGTSKMPQRQFLGIGADDVPKIEEIIRQHLGL
jgi:phage virion morphogenesis protein